jgi:capsid protein
MGIIKDCVNLVSSEIRYKAAVATHNYQALSVITQGYKANGWGGFRSGVQPSMASEDTIIRRDWQALAADAMDLYRNDPITRSVVDTIGRYLGVSRAIPATSDPKWNQQAFTYFNDYWWNQADARERPGCDFGTIQDFWNNMAFLQGDMLCLLTDGQLYPYEGMQIATPAKLARETNIINGVRTDGTFPHRITHYYTCPVNTYGRVDRNLFDRHARNQVIYAGSEYWRPNMLRSVCDLHGVLDQLRDFDDTQTNVAGKIKFESKMVTKERKGALGRIPGSKLIDATGADGQTERVEISEAGNLMRFKINGDINDLQVQAMENPGGYYIPYMEFVARMIAAGVGIPYEIVLHIYTSGSYTANRAARCDFKQYLLDRWGWRRKVLCQPVYNWRIAKAIKDGDLPPAPVNPITGISEWYKCNWTKPHLEQIDEEKDANGDEARWKLGQDTLADWAEQQATTVDEMLNARDMEIKDMQKRASALKIPLQQYMPALFGDTPVINLTTNSKTKE